MDTCIYCSSSEELSEEHVFPASFGCPWALARAVCTKCNNKFNQEFEGRFIQSTAVLRALLAIRDRYGKVPEVTGPARIHGVTHPVRVSGGKLISIPTLKMRLRKRKNEQPFKFITFTPEQDEALLRGLAKKGSKLKELSSQKEIIDGEVVLPLDFRFLGKRTTLRAISKFAYTGLAFVGGASFARSAAFKGIRSFIRTGRGAPPTRIFINTDVAPKARFSCSTFTLMVACDGLRGRSEAIVVLFGCLFYLVTLSDKYRGPDVFKTIAFDGKTRSENVVIAGSVLSESEIIKLVHTAKTIWDTPKASAGFLMKALIRCGMDIRLPAAPKKLAST